MLNFFKKLFGLVDANKDGKVNAADVKIVADKVEAKAEAAAVAVKTAGKKTAAKIKAARAGKPKPKA